MRTRIPECRKSISHESGICLLHMASASQLPALKRPEASDRGLGAGALAAC